MLHWGIVAFVSLCGLRESPNLAYTLSANRSTCETVRVQRTRSLRLHAVWLHGNRRANRRRNSRNGGEVIYGETVLTPQATCVECEKAAAKVPPVK